MVHKFGIGQLVRYVGARFGSPESNIEFTVVRLMPEAEYRIKSEHEPTERVAREYELRSVIDSDGGSNR
jgi:hypothetical protein